MNVRLNFLIVTNLQLQPFLRQPGKANTSLSSPPSRDRDNNAAIDQQLTLLDFAWHRFPRVIETDERTLGDCE